jgi:hypothetical protein
VACRLSGGLAPYMERRWSSGATSADRLAEYHRLRRDPQSDGLGVGTQSPPCERGARPEMEEHSLRNWGSRVRRRPRRARGR